MAFVTKYRHEAMDSEMPTRCEEIRRDVCKDFDTDHAHLPVHYLPKVALSASSTASKASRPDSSARSSPAG
ncbi:hypothetical protein ACFYST_20010 [Kitasatospora sp. NPDC004614]|uniref:hypothetical protein n=1 Tax=unclassified Kitasatospora TaxID=2633591 RepID=UPI0036BD6863